MSLHPIADKAEVSVDFPDKAYMGSFSRHSQFDAYADTDSVAIRLVRPGEDRREAVVHLHYGLLAGILAELAKSLAAHDPLDEQHRMELSEAAKQLAASLEPRERQQVDKVSYKALSTVLAALASALVVAHSVRADVQKGAQIARQWCANCHVIDRSSAAAVPQGPPTFPTIARSGMTNDQLRAFLSHPHGAMPDLALTRAEIDDLIGYIGTLR